MAGKIVNATEQDSIRIEVASENRSVQVPASLVLALDTVLRYCLMEYADLCLDRMGDYWQLTVGNCEYSLRGGSGDTPWTALIALAQKIEAGRKNG